MHIFAHLTRHSIQTALAGFLVLILWPAVSTAQNQFSPVVQINDTAITQYELSQRELLLSVLRTPGFIEKVALENLINERLQLSAATLAGITVDDDELAAGIEEFSARANLTGEQLIVELNKEGISTESFRDFVLSGLAWRELVQSRFGASSIVSDGEVNRAIDRAFEQAGNRATARVLISEIYLAANTPQAKAESEALAKQIAKAESFAGFSAAARKYSIGPSAQRGGRVETWVSLSDLPAAIGSTLLQMKPGEITNPFQLAEAFVIFQLRAIEEVPAPVRTNVSLEYLTYHIAGGSVAAQKLRARVDICDDLYAVAKGQPEETLQLDELPVAQIPSDIAVELAKLDVGEVSTALTRNNGQTTLFLMLCSRKTTDAPEQDPRIVKQQLTNQRLASYADAYLAELKADAIIIFP